MTALLASYSHTERGPDGEIVELRRGDELDGVLSPERIEELKAAGAVVGHEPDSGLVFEEDSTIEALADEGAAERGGEDAYDDAVVALAAKIAEQRLNASDTVGLAGDDPQQAELVLAAELHNANPDPRSTVVEPLKKIIDAAQRS
mgnify:CR=1 FL=1